MRATLWQNQRRQPGRQPSTPEGTFELLIAYLPPEFSCLVPCGLIKMTSTTWVDSSRGRKMKSFSQVQYQLADCQNPACFDGFVCATSVALRTGFLRRREVYALDLAQSIRQKYDYSVIFYFEPESARLEVRKSIRSNQLNQQATRYFEGPLHPGRSDFSRIALI